MKLLTSTYLLLIFITHVSCTKQSNDIIFDASFPGARLDSVVRLDENSYEAIINPAFEPVNKSPWFAFAVSSYSPKTSQELPYCYNYFINEFDCEAVTYEEGDEIDRNILKSRAKIYAQNLMKTLLFKLKNNEL